MGTFRIRAQFVDTQSGINAYAVGSGVVVSPPSDADLLTIVNKFPLDVGFLWSTFGFIGTGIVNLFPDDTGIFLDGSLVPVTSGTLPPGFNVLTARVEQSSQTDGDGSASWTLFNGAFVSTLNAALFDYPQPVTLAGILITQFGINFTANALSGVIGLYTIITGTYDIVATATVGPDPIAPAGPGVIVTISSPDVNPDLEEVSDVTLQIDDEDPVHVTVYLTQTPTSLSFALPAAFTDDDIAKQINVSMTVFSGSVELNPLHILIADASGIYTLVEGKRTDTLYIDSPDDTTLEVKIPNPFIKTGFIGG